MTFSFLRGLLLSTALLATVAQAAPEDVIRNKLKTVIPDIELTSIKAAPLPGYYEVRAKNYENVLVSADGRYMIQGSILEIQGDKIVSLTDQSQAGERSQALAAVKTADMVIFPAVGKPKAVIYAFTDVECGYCRKLHTEVPQLNKMGIEVRYLAWPRSGPDSPVAKEMADVWCSKDPRQALTQAKKGVAPPAAAKAASCSKTVTAQYNLGESLGVNGTPAVFSAAGLQLGGYLPAAEMAKSLGLR